ncbi:hypothetical protein BYT27DRAFT_7210444 [Phlegmacium glaucopus]|nr:hypothetical protein BYT27DRAFT_7210444 [Phlegmacium glaucopus]
MAWPGPQLGAGPRTSLRSKYGRLISKTRLTALWDAQNVADCLASKISREAQECPTASQGPGNGLAIPVQMKDMQSKFQCKVKQEDITARSNLGPTFQRFSIIKERLAHHTEIDCNEIYADMPGLESAPPKQDNNQDQDANDPDFEEDNI